MILKEIMGGQFCNNVDKNLPEGQGRGFLICFYDIPLYIFKRQLVKT